MKKIKWISLLLAVTLAAATLSGCSGGQSAPSGSEDTAETSLLYNPLTGEQNLAKDAENLRPMAVVISNIKNANPQDGTTSADILYEALAEGGITRMMGVFADYRTMPSVGPVRSAREYFIHFAMGLDAQYVHFGGSITAKALIANSNLGDKTIDGGYYTNSGAVHLDPVLQAERGGQEHAHFTSGKMIQIALDDKEVTMKTADGKAYVPLFTFCYYNRVPSEKKALEVTVPFSAYNTSKFVYSENTGLYTKYQWGEKQTERNSGDAIEVKNVFVIFAKMWNYNNTQLLQADLSSGEGYYITNGGAQKITWKKGDLFDRLTFYDADGKELLVNEGKSYICMLPTDQQDAFEIRSSTNK